MSVMRGVFIAILALHHPVMGRMADTTSSVVWHLDNLFSIGGHPVTVAGDPVVREFDTGKAMEFDGVDDGVIVHGCPLDTSPSFTIEILFKPYTSFPNNAEQRFLHIQHQNRESRRVLVELRLTGNNEWFVDTHIRADSSFLTCLAENFPHPVGRWYHVAFVYEKGEGRHFVNGVEEMRGEVPYVPVEEADVSLGMRMNRKWFFKGAIQSVCMTRRALTPDEFVLSSQAYRTNKGGSAGELLFSDDCGAGTDNWIAEFEDSAASSISAAMGMLDVSTSAGATIWYRNKLPGNIVISYDVTVIDSGGRNDRVSDLNAFWMASDPSRNDPFTRNGKFSSYDNLDLYYAGVGGHDNTTTRFRRYHYGGTKPVLREYMDTPHLLEGNKVYSIEIRVTDGRTSFSVNGVPFFDYADKIPLTEGYFGFRTTKSHQRFANFKVRRPAP